LLLISRGCSEVSNIYIHIIEISHTKQNRVYTQITIAGIQVLTVTTGMLIVHNVNYDDITTTFLIMKKALSVF